MATNNALAALARIQDSPRTPNESIQAWLHRHKEDLVVLLQAKSAPMVAELVGVKASDIYNFRSSAGLTKQPIHSDTHRDTTYAPGTQPTRKELPLPPEASADPGAEDLAYVRGQRDAYRDVVHRVFPLEDTTTQED